MEKPAAENRVLIVDDQQDLLVLLRKVVSKKCHCKVEVAGSGTSALDLLESWQPDVVLTDIKMPDVDGLELQKKIARLDPLITIIFMTGFGTIEMAVQALKNGVYDFIEKPFDNDVIVSVIKRALERTHLLRENQKLQQRLKKDAQSSYFIGRSPRLMQTQELLARLAASDATVLIRGESGTGKELAARTIHALSKRANRKMVTVNCPALPEQILESELFGYSRGAFTGADADKEGLFLKADGSTILLDEIADISLAVQSKLLRVLQEKEIQPLGQTKTIKIDVRVLASTNQDLERKITQGEFREDLYYRLNVMTVTMPTLVEIADDIPLLARHFLEIFAREYDKEGLEFSPGALQCLMQRPWKGNVRELQNTINRGVLLCTGRQVTTGDLISAAHENGSVDLPHGTECNNALQQLPYNLAKEEVVNSFAASYLHNALTRTQGNVSAAARQSGLERQAFQRLLRRYNIRSDEFRT
ncbi:MAG: sigma-54 dependent transcriptional regulator [Desulfobulbaceae bacterium]|nr:sigma-54 dependent transcriptional regulator [Desulfobulbaceae bacterium]